MCHKLSKALYSCSRLKEGDRMRVKERQTDRQTEREGERKRNSLSLSCYGEWVCAPNNIIFLLFFLQPLHLSLIYSSVTLSVIRRPPDLESMVVGSTRLFRQVLRRLNLRTIGLEVCNPQGTHLAPLPVYAIPRCFPCQCRQPCLFCPLSFPPKCSLGDSL